MKGRLAILAAAIFWSTSGFFVKSPTLSDIEPVGDRGLLIACWRCFFAALALLPLLAWQWWRDRDITTFGEARTEEPREMEATRDRDGATGMTPGRTGLARRWLPLLACFAAMNGLFVAAMTRADAGDVIFLQYMAPLWVLIGGVLWLGERVVRANLAALGLGLAGVLVIVQASRGGDGLAGALLALGAGVAYAGVILSLRALKGEDPLRLILGCLVASWLVLLPLALPLTEGLDHAQWAWIAILGVIQMAVPYVLFAWGLKWVTAQEGALITLLEPVLNPLWVWTVWGEAMAGHTLVGGALILSGLVLRYGLGDGKSQASDNLPSDPD